MRCCANCDYSVVVEGDPEGTLECRRHAITAVGLDEDGGVVCAFPGCEPAMWCGDWKYTPRLRYDVDYSMWEG